MMTYQRNRHRQEAGFFSIVEAAEILGISSDTLWAYLRDGRLPKPKQRWMRSRRLYYTSKDVAWIKQQMAQKKTAEK